MSEIKAIALDAMGVMYTVGDDLRDILIPYLRTQGCAISDDEIIGLYRRCYRDGMAAEELWRATGCERRDGALEDDFIARYELTHGLVEFLQSMKTRGTPLFCLSNDVAEWAVKKRRYFELEAYFDGCVISGEQKVVKPSSAIYESLAKMLPCSPDECLFVDDREQNVKAAVDLGFRGVVFNSTSVEGLPAVEDFPALRQWVEMATGTP